ncbi:MAG: right-handed parallel beta-helix repeat-containing protein [Myxococcota bacterium]|jgi:hypothetical protein|nr:right-handed parallel beta-helix repeat-containing protein [Myxococcota bacterium]
MPIRHLSTLLVLVLFLGFSSCADDDSAEGDPGIDTDTDSDTDTDTDAEWPNETNTGVPAGTVLTDYGTPGEVLTVTEEGAVFDGLHIRSTGTYFDINVLADNVTFRSCRFGNIVIGYGQGGYGGLLIEDSEFVSNGGPSEYTVRRSYIHSEGDNIRLGGFNVLIEDSYLFTTGGNHIDCIQCVGTCGDVVIRHNTIENSGTATACLNVSGLGYLIENNLIAGGGFTIYMPEDATHMQVIDNHFSTEFYPECGNWGVLYNAWNASGEGNVWSGNVWHETGLPLEP